MSTARPSIYGVMAEFESGPKLVEATQRAYAAGYRQMDAYSPYPVEGLSDALGFHETHVPTLVLCGGICGGLAGFALQYYCAVIAYPLNIGNKPLNSWPAFIPVTFETTVLIAAFSAVLGMLFLNGLPQPYHPAFNVPRFALASRDRFFLLIDSRDKNFEPAAVTQFMAGLNPYAVTQVQP